MCDPFSWEGAQLCEISEMTDCKSLPFSQTNTKVTNTHTHTHTKKKKKGKKEKKRKEIKEIGQLNIVKIFILNQLINVM